MRTIKKHWERVLGTILLIVASLTIIGSSKDAKFTKVDCLINGAPFQIYQAFTWDGVIPRFARIQFDVYSKGGNWVGITFKDKENNMYDLPPLKVSDGHAGTFYWAVPAKCPVGPLFVTIALWEGYDGNKMIGELDRISWSKMGEVVPAVGQGF
jgi:hypothetical protein